MKIDRDNFRHLTGFGRDMANRVDAVLADEYFTRQTGPGELTIQCDHDENRFTWNFRPDEFLVERVRNRTDDPYVELLSRSNLNITVDHQGFREITLVPLAFVSSLCFGHYNHIYQHIFIHDENRKLIENARYTGITKRGWRTRWKEHLHAARSGSHCLFHKAIRQWNGRAKCVMHAVAGISSSEREAMEIEEYIVERDSFYPLGLNMIPGGYAGIAHLRNLNVIGKRERVGIDDIDAVINRYCERASRKGESNLKAALNWLMPAYAEKVICGGSDRLKPQQIHEARLLASLGQDTDNIAMRIGARNSAQVQRLLSGQTYSRIL